MTNNKQTLEEANALLQERMEECGGDFLEYLRKYNRHTLSVSLTDEQTGKDLWEGKSITFMNEDNAISHLSLLSEFLGLLTKEENKGWGYEKTSQEIVERILNPIKDRLMGEYSTYQDNNED